MIINTDLIYPIGSIYITTSTISPETLFGGTWERYSQGRFLLGAGTGTDWTGTSQTYNAVGDMGGEYNHTLSIQELPDHDHRQIIWDASPFGLLGVQGGQSYPRTLSVDGGTQQNYNPRTGGTGGGQAHNNVPPYIVVYMWRRTA